MKTKQTAKVLSVPARVEYYARITSQAEGGFLVQFPDLPGCLTEGDTIDEALANAAEALSGWLPNAQRLPLPIELKGRLNYAPQMVRIDGLQIGYVNGFGYNQVLPAPEAELAERFQRAEQVFAKKLWREQLRDWDENRKPSSIATHRELQAVNPDALSDAELVAYLTRCRDHHSAMIAQHMRFTAAAVLPTGDFIAHVGDWTGLPPSELLGLMRGLLGQVRLLRGSRCLRRGLQCDRPGGLPRGPWRGRARGRSGRPACCLPRRGGFCRAPCGWASQVAGREARGRR
jgi:predicted RNase H-like HicB family nuclease